MPDFHIVKLRATRSTSDELKLRFRESVLPTLTAISTYHQTSGRGQRGNSWVSDAGKNLTFSFLWHNDIGLKQVFDLTKFISVVLVAWLRDEYQVAALIKWPNDILSDGKKIAGILVENFYRGSIHTYSIIGIGLNINQTEFKGLPHATSLKNLTAKTYDPDQLLESLMTTIAKSLTDFKQVKKRYTEYLAGYQQLRTFKRNNEQIKATILGVNSKGLLQLSHNGESKLFDLKEIEWVYLNL